jgi:hypothetical protein
VEKGVGLLFCCALATVASLRGATAADPEELLRRGVELRRRERDAEALTFFQQSYELNKAPKALAQVGLAEQALGKWGAADRHLRTAIQSASDPWIVKHREAIEQALGTIGQHVGRLDVRGGPAGAEVRVDGDVIGSLPLAGPFSVSAGGVAIEVRSDGYVPIVRASTIPVGILTRETFDLQPIASVAATKARPLAVAVAPSMPPPPPPPSPPNADEFPGADESGKFDAGSSRAPANAAESTAPGGSIRSVVAVGAIVLAGAAVTFGVIEHVSWQSKASQFHATTGCDPAVAQRGSPICEGFYNDGRRAEVLALIGYGVGVGLAAVATTLYLSAPSDTSNANQVACAVSPFAFRAGCTMRF